MVAITLAALLAFAPLQAAPQTPPPPAVAQPAPGDEEPVELGDVEVTGRSLDSLIDSFVEEVAEPNRGRGLARWDERVCIGVANLQTEPAQYIVDRVSTVAEDVGLEPGEPGCKPNVIIIASDDPSGLAATLVEEREKAFRMGGSGMDRGGAALQRFVASDAPVRWWQQAMPVDSGSGQRAVRIPGECTGACMSPMSYAPQLNIGAASRLNTPIVDLLFRTVIIVDVNKVDTVSINQLSDYLAMVTLAQIDPDADTLRYASVLNVFEEPDSVEGLTDWDRAYLTGLYGAERNRKSLRANRNEISAEIHRAHRDLREGEGEAE